MKRIGHALAQEPGHPPEIPSNSPPPPRATLDFSLGMRNSFHLRMMQE